MNYNKRTHTCGDLRLSNLNNEVTLNGWVAKKRDLGGLIFIDLRDRYGVTQLKITPDKKQLHDIASKLGLEFVISSKGMVIKRESINPNIPTGEIEIDVNELQILNESLPTPFIVEDDVKASEELRFQYRYLDLRRQKMAQNLITRNKVFQTVHKFFEKEGFIEIETPILMKSTPEGARDYLVPSRIHKGKFFALPQSPQTYKQILMVAGMDKYVQICKCFRDEDLRADRQPEFTQIDLEMSFVDQDDVFKVTENLMYNIWKDASGIEIQTPFPKYTYDDCIKYFGTDKPDLRVKGEIKLHHLNKIFTNSEFAPFKDALTNNGSISGISVKDIQISRKVIDELTEFVKKSGFGGLGYFKFSNNEFSGPLAKFLSDTEKESLIGEFELNSDSTVFILSGDYKKVCETLGSLRLKIAETFQLINESDDKFLWVTDFPLFAFDEEEGRYVGEHHVFTSPKPEFEHLLDSDKKEEILSIRANCYDLVLNGQELASGSIRIHNYEMQKKVFNLIGLSDEEARQKFGFILDAFRYGAPPHGGIAPGLDRIVARLCGVKDIREVIAFPKSTSTASLMDESPSIVSDKQLKELSIKITSEK